MGKFGLGPKDLQLDIDEPPQAVSERSILIRSPKAAPCTKRYRRSIGYTYSLGAPADLPWLVSAPGLGSPLRHDPLNPMSQLGSGVKTSALASVSFPAFRCPPFPPL